MSAPSSWKDVVDTPLLSIAQVPDSKQSPAQLVSLEASASLDTLVATLHKHKILSVPVVDKDQVLGFADLLDLVKHVCDSAPDPKKITADELRSLSFQGKDLSDVHVSKIIDASGFNPYVPCHAKNRLQQVLPFFAVGVHRTCLLAEDDKPVAMLSQSDVARFLVPLLKGSLNETGKKSLKELGWEAKGVQTVSTDTSVLDCMRTLVDQKVPAVAVTDPQSKDLVGSFSAKALRGLNQSSLALVLKNVHEFLQERAPSALKPPLAHAEDSLLSTVETLVNGHHHRLWVVDNEKNPVGLVSLTDVMNIVKKQGQ